MKLEVTEKGVYGADGEAVPVGTILDVKGDKIPPSLVNKVRIVADAQKRRGKGEAKAPELTREGIAELDEAAVDELLAAHMVSAEGASLDDKRAALIQIMFVDV